MSIKQSFNFLLRCADNDNITGESFGGLSTLFPGRQGKRRLFSVRFLPLTS